MSARDDDHRSEADAVMAAVAAAWHAALDAEPFDPDRRLVDTGADSLRVMQFVLRLEHTLGRKVTYDVISPETTPRTLAATLSKTDDRAATLPRVFYLSGLAGTDYRMLSHLRTSLGGEIVFTHVDAPGLGQPSALLCDLAATAAWIAANIGAIQPDGPINIAGYSVGGFQAFEVARHLIESGRDVAFLCLFDPTPRRSIARIIGDTLRRPKRLISKVRRSPRAERVERMAIGPSRLVNLALRFGAYGLASSAATLAGSAGGSAGRDEPALFRLWQRRLLAIKRWRPRPLAVNAMLVLTDDGARFGVGPFWQKLIDGVSIHAVTGSHDALSKTPVSDDLRSAFLACLHRSRHRASPSSA